MYGKGYLSKTLYNGGVIKSSLYTTTYNLLKDLIKNCGLIMNLNPPNLGIMEDTINSYDVVITDVAGTPNGGDFVDGNYFKINGQFQQVIDADTSNIFYSITEVPNIISIAGIGDNIGNQLFINKPEKVMAFTETAISGTCEQKVLKLLGFNMSLLATDANGDYTVDANGEYAYEGV